jgi:CHAD domain-containing protein
MNKVKSKIMENATKYLNEAIEFLKSDDIIQIKNSFLENIKNKAMKKKYENEFDQNFIKSYIETKINVSKI